MELQHINAKFFVDGELSVDPEEFIPVFHRWVRDKEADELLIDVADYRHVPNGPGVMLIGFEADYSLDQNAGRWGLLYNRKAPLKGSNPDRIQQAVSSALQACDKLEAEFDGQLKFCRKELELIINDRAYATNSAESLAECQPEFEAALSEMLGGGEFTMQQTSDDPRSRLAVTVKADSPFDLAVAK